MSNRALEVMGAIAATVVITAVTALTVVGSVILAADIPYVEPEQEKIVVLESQRRYRVVVVEKPVHIYNIHNP